VRLSQPREQEDNERYITVTVRAIGLAYIVVLLVFALAWLR
jgi:hypothetical protein